MARPLRIEKAGGWYHVTARGNERKAIFRDDRDRRHFLELLVEMVLRFHLGLHCFVLMENHYHVLLELSEANLSRAVQWLNVSYSIWFNRRHGRSGHLFQGRFKSVAVSRDEWALALSRYLHLNPVRLKRLGLGKRERQAQRVGLSSAPEAAQVRERMGRLRAFRWSSYRAYVGLERPVSWLECQTVLDLGGGVKAEQQQQYRQYVQEGGAGGVGEKPVGSIAGTGGLGRGGVSGGAEKACAWS
jgi:putative transposase